MTGKPHRDASPRRQAGEAIPLSQLAPGARARVAGTRHGHGQVHRLASLGLAPGSELALVTGGPRGPVIVEVRGARYIIGRGMAQDILVEPSHPPAARP